MARKTPPTSTALSTMPVESTLAVIKPDAFTRADAIVATIKQHGFAVAEREVITLTEARAGEFYAEHKERPFYSDLVAFMSSGPCIAMVLRKDNAIAEWRALMGPTDSAAARDTEPESIRARFGTDGFKNATHGSDSATSAAREISFFFPHFAAPIPYSSVNAKDYLATTVSPLLTNALTEMCRLNPPEPVEWLGQYLLRSVGAGNAKTAAKSAPRIFFVLGGPGSGKGTQCAKLVEKFGFAHLSAGDLLRAEVASGSEQGIMIGDMIKEGTIVPGEITINLLKKAIAGCHAPGILIDGFPRQLNQAGAFEKDVSDFEFVLFFDCPEEEMERRILERGKTSGRTDDNIESIRKRFNTFAQTSLPVIEYYEAKGKVHRIDATQTVEAVFEQVQGLF